MNKINCKICNRDINIKGLTLHLKTHNIIFKDYINKYPEQFPNWHPCLICKTLTIQKITCSKECDREYRKTLIGEKSAHYGKHLSKESKKKISKKRLENQKLGKYNFLKGNTNPACKKEVREKMSKTHLERGNNKGKNNPMYGKTHSPEAIKKIFSYRKMNKLEKLVADFLKKNNIKYIFQFFINKDGICKSYDFKIKNKPIILEIDGDFWHGGPGSKTHWKDVKKVKKNDILKERIAKEEGYKIIRFWESELKNNINILSQYLLLNNKEELNV